MYRNQQPEHSNGNQQQEHGNGNHRPRHRNQNQHSNRSYRPAAEHRQHSPSPQARNNNNQTASFDIVQECIELAHLERRCTASANATKEYNTRYRRATKMCSTRDEAEFTNATIRTLAITPKIDPKKQPASAKMQHKLLHDIVAHEMILPPGISLMTTESLLRYTTTIREAYKKNIIDLTTVSEWLLEVSKYCQKHYATLDKKNEMLHALMQGCRVIIESISGNYLERNLASSLLTAATNLTIITRHYHTTATTAGIYDAMYNAARSKELPVVHIMPSYDIMQRTEPAILLERFATHTPIIPSVQAGCTTVAYQNALRSMSMERTRSRAPAPQAVHTREVSMHDPYNNHRTASPTSITARVIPVDLANRDDNVPAEHTPTSVINYRHRSAQRQQRSGS